eukprot:939634-Karenia_brevis.AAC.1
MMLEIAKSRSRAVHSLPVTNASDEETSDIESVSSDVSSVIEVSSESEAELVIISSDSSNDTD